MPMKFAHAFRGHNAWASQEASACYVGYYQASCKFRLHHKFFLFYLYQKQQMRMIELLDYQQTCHGPDKVVCQGHPGRDCTTRGDTPKAKLYAWGSI